MDPKWLKSIFFRLFAVGPLFKRVGDHAIVVPISPWAADEFQKIFLGHPMIVFSKSGPVLVSPGFRVVVGHIDDHVIAVHAMEALFQTEGIALPVADTLRDHGLIVIPN